MSSAARVPPLPRGRPLAVVVLAAAALLVVLAVLDGPLRAEEGEGGTIALELAGGEQRAEEIVASWESRGKVAQAAFVLGLDNLYLVLAAIGMAGLCLAVGRGLGSRGARLAALAPPLAWCALAGGAFDALENVSLTAEVLDEPRSPWPELALAAAIPKFVLNTATLVYVLIGGALIWIRSRSSPAPS